MKIHYFADERYQLGKIIIKNYKEKVGIEETKEILLSYLQRRDRNLNRLLKYAKKMKCEKIIRQYLEVLV